jgi:hypothetical protein
MRYLCLVYGTEDGLPVMQNPNPISKAEWNALALHVLCSCHGDGCTGPGRRCAPAAAHLVYIQIRTSIDHSANVC